MNRIELTKLIYFSAFILVLVFCLLNYRTPHGLNENSLSSPSPYQSANLSPNLLWEENGTLVCNPNHRQSEPKILDDGEDGAIIVWSDYRSGSDYDIYAQRINSSGEPLWNLNGTAICTASGNQKTLAICSDHEGGAIITWIDYRNANYDIYSQRINSTGSVQWDFDGVIVCNANNDQMYPKIIPDTYGGAYIVWVDGRSGVDDIYIQRINADGLSKFTVNGTALCTYSEIQDQVYICSDSGTGAIVVWRDNRTGQYDIYAQRIDENGVIQWTADGIAIANEVDMQFAPQICSNGVDGAIITWSDNRSDDFDVYAQWLDLDGNTKWGDNGTLICGINEDQYGSKVCADGLGEFILIWGDYRNPTLDLYAQKIP